MSEGNQYNVSISYIGDLAHTPPDDVVLVEQDSDFVRVCHALSRLENTDAGPKVWVRSRNHFAWLRDFTEQIDRPATYDEKTARLVLAEQWNVQVPEWLTDSVVLDQKLLELDVDAKHPERFETRFLTHFLGAVFKPDVFDLNEVVDAMEALVSDDVKTAFNKYPLLNRCLKFKCEQWAKKASETWVKEFLSRILDDYFQVWQWLNLWSGLNNYPEKLIEYVLAPEQVLFVRKIPLDAVCRLPFEPTSREQMLTQIELFFDEIQDQVTSSDEFQKIVGCTSGRLSQEYHHISSILKSNRFAPSKQDVQAVQEKFRSCPGVSETHLSALGYCVKPEYPTLLGPEEEWSRDQWIRWTVEEYVPFRTWQVHNSQYDEGVEQTVVRFTGWYIDEYASIHKDPDFSLTHCLSALSQNPPSIDFTVILLVDCLPLALMDLLDEALRNVGFSRHDLHYRFSGLPTITEYNKAALLQGEWQVGSGNYEAILKKRALSEWNGRQVIYLSNLKSMSEMAPPQESTIAVLNFLDGDELLHSDVESKNISYEEELHRLFARMAESVSRLSQEWSGSREQFNVYVVTDHGACRILEEEKRSFDSTVINNLFFNEKHRFSAVDEGRVDEIPENMWALGHRFKRPFTSDDTNFFLPKGHNTVRQAGKAKGYMHGGATPEEVIVPTALYKLVKTAWKVPGARFLNLDLEISTGRAKFYIQRVVTLEIEIQNPNTTAIHIHRATVMSPETDLKSFETIEIPSGSVKPFKMNCYFKKAALGDRNLEIEIAYEISGDQRTFHIVLESKFKSAISSGFSLRDL